MPLPRQSSPKSLAWKVILMSFQLPSPACHQLSTYPKISREQAYFLVKDLGKGEVRVRLAAVPIANVGPASSWLPTAPSSASW